jgi:hypothetical protein
MIRCTYLLIAFAVGLGWRVVEVSDGEQESGRVLFCFCLGVRIRVSVFFFGIDDFLMG